MSVTVLAPALLAVAHVVPTTDRHWPGVVSTAVEVGAGGPGWETVVEGLRARVGAVDGVVFTGAEPTAQPGIIGALNEVRRLGYRVGLRTTGAYPHGLAEVLPHVDWVGLELSCTEPIVAWTSLELVMRSRVDYEVTLTVDPARHSRRHVLNTAREVIRRGAHAPVLQGRGLYQVIGLGDLPDLERR